MAVGLGAQLGASHGKLGHGMMASEAFRSPQRAQGAPAELSVSITALWGVLCNSQMLLMLLKLQQAFIGNDFGAKGSSRRNFQNCAAIRYK